jgi:putative RecB family exonuclease
MIAAATTATDEAKAATAPSDPTSAPLDYLSASRLNCFQECRLKFYFRYVERAPTPTSPGLFVGKVTHAVLQRWNMARWRGEPSDPETLRPAFDGCWEEGQAGEDIAWEGKEDAARANTWAMLEHYFGNTPIPVGEKPEAVEVVVERDLLAHGLPPLRGVIDLVREGGRIVDFKTAARSPSPSMAGHQNAVQLGCYALLYREATGHDEGGFELHHLVKTKVPKLVVTTLDPMEPVQTRRLIRQMESYVEGVTAGDFVPSPGMHCAWCDHFARCRAWEGGDPPC